MTPTGSATAHLPGSAMAERTVAGPPRPRQCGRCRSFFVGAADDDLSDATIWWACPECHAKLFGSGIGRRRLADIAGVV